MSDREKIPYVIFGQKDKDIHDTVRANLVGGPSVIFHRHHAAGATKLRERLYGSSSKTCQHLLGVDANSLYLKCMGEDHCTGFYVVRRRTDNFRPSMSQEVSYSATEWLKYRAHKDHAVILHQYNHGEIKIGGKQIRVDGYVVEERKIYQFHGCYWHGHTCHLTKNMLKSEKGRDFLAERAQRTIRVGNYLRCLGYQVIEIHECEWLKLKTTEESARMKHIWNVPRPSSKRDMTEEEIVRGIEDGSIFGMAQVDIMTPEHLRDLFSEMTPVFKNVKVRRQDVGEHMLRHLEEEGKMKQPQRQLIGSYFGDKILLGTPLLRWYLTHGLKVTKVHLVVEYVPEKSFLSFVNEVTEARRQGDKNTDCKILSDLYKLLGNSSYGKTICNKQNYTHTRYVTTAKAMRLAGHWSVQNVSELSDTTVEITSLPRKVVYDLPIQIGFMVYQYAKLKMLSFYYDFLLRYVDRKDFELCEMDTDSLYFALSTDTLEEAVIPEMREEFFRERHKWLPSESCDISYHRESYIKARTHNLVWLPPPCCQERTVYDQRTPGLFKIEWEGDVMTSLNSKCYLGEGKTQKMSCKGVIQHQNSLDMKKYRNVLETRKSHHVTNKNFRTHEHSMVTYQQSKTGLNYMYVKRKVCSDGVSTIPLDI